MKTALIVGAGFEGMACALYLRETYGFDVALVDAATQAGAVMRGIPHGEFHLDIGCQVFDNFDARVSDVIVKLADGQCEYEDIPYGSRFNGVVSTDVAVPNLSVLPTDVVEQIEHEVQETNSDGLTAHTLAEYYEQRWGRTAAQALECVNQKVLAASAVDLDQSSRIFAGLSRLKVFRDDRTALTLKAKDPLLDAKVAVPRGKTGFYAEDQKDIPNQNIVPIPRSFGSFCETSVRVLERCGVSVQLGTRLQDLVVPSDGGPVQAFLNRNGSASRMEADIIVWCAPFGWLCKLLGVKSEIDAFLDPIGLSITYFFAPAKNIDKLGYLQNYDDDMRFFRWSSMGLYSRQISADGISFCCVETPSETELLASDDSAGAMQDWEDLVALNLVSDQPLSQPKTVFAKNGLKRRRPGFSQAASEAMAHLALQTGQNLVYQKPDAFGRTPTARNLFNEIDQLVL